MTFPQIEKIPFENSYKIFSHFARTHGSVFLDSALTDSHFGRYSFIGVDPFLILSSKNGHITLNGKSFFGNPFWILKEKLQEFPMTNHPNYPPFQGGAMGYFGYDLCHHLEKLPSNRDDMSFPDLMIGFYDLVIGLDHFENEAWIFSSGFPEKKISEREIRAKNRIQWIKQKLSEPINLMENVHSEKVENIISNFTQKAYEKSLQRTIDYIYSGDIFQANISQRFCCDRPKNFNSFHLYQRLRTFNAAPFGAFLNYDDLIIASASPERFLKLTDGKVETRPIKGTRPRGLTKEQDQNYAEELLTSEKDRAENVMVVDLLRNDLSRVCKDHSVTVEKLCILESYATVHHLVSVITGELKKELDAIDLLTATFPGGSITGAPKIRAMEIIAEIEPTQRGPYCGSIGYIGFNGDMDTSIVIRTFAIKNNKIIFQSGGGVVADSNPREEYKETLIKAKALRRTLTELIED